MKLQVINEVFRIANVSPGLLRKLLKDIKFKGTYWKNSMNSIF